MATPYEYISPELDVFDNHSTCFELAVPHRGEITKFVVTQESGAVDGFSVDLFNSRSPCPPGPAESMSSEAVSSGSEDLYKIFPTKSVAGNKIADNDGLTKYPYRNVDGSYSVPERKLYLRINPGGTGSTHKVYRVAMSIGTPEF